MAESPRNDILENRSFAGSGPRSAPIERNSRPPSPNNSSHQSMRRVPVKMGRQYQMATPGVVILVHAVRLALAGQIAQYVVSLFGFYRSPYATINTTTGDGIHVMSRIAKKKIASESDLFLGRRPQPRAHRGRGGQGTARKSNQNLTNKGGWGRAQRAPSLQRPGGSVLVPRTATPATPVPVLFPRRCQVRTGRRVSASMPVPIESDVAGHDRRRQQDGL